MSVTELYTKDAKVWIPDEDLVWKSAILLEDFTGQKTLKLQIEEDEQEAVVPINSHDQLPPLKNPEILIGENDLTSLSYLHEPAVLYNLQVRFCDRNDIYTYCGIVLVAINPYDELPIYDNDTIQAYSGQDMGSMDPHIFAVAEEAFKRMSRFDENQSVIVSGESGAGKTVSAKYAMRYFATVCGAEAETQIEIKVLASNPIMEAIGNAKTTRNDNSSRFGKYIEIGFSKKDMIIGANMRTYLLEKTRVVFQASEERNYHIFYQLCASADLPEFESLKLNDPDIFFYTNQGEAPYIDGVNDAQDLINTREAFSLLGITEVRQLDIFRVISGILHMGNILFKEEDNDMCSVSKGDKHLPLMTEMLGINEDQIRMWLCNKKVVTANEVITKPLTVTQAYFARDALAKHVYSMMFDWIVKELNKSLSSTHKQTKFIGVLDIYGFETFQTNSFEQFCINYANEKLQQQFCLHVFKLEQEEYVKEQIEWSFIDFYDNQPCIDLIEGKLGILDLLDEECKMPKGSDKNWCQKLYEKHTKHHHFEKPRMSQTSFIIHHFADHVEYTMDGFLEKNRDTVLEDHINILKASQFEFVADLFTEGSADSSPQPGVVARGGKQKQKGGVLRAAKEQPKSQRGSSHKKTVGSQFRDSLNRLMETLFSTTPHYIRCIKPNDLKMAFTFDPHRAVQQLRACGVLETVRISAAGYPSRWTYGEFFQRYRVLAHSKQIIKKDIHKTCENILVNLIDDRDKYQFGRTKIFFRAGQVAYLEKLRSDRLRYCGILIQKHVRGWLARIKYQRVRKMVQLVQRHGRGLLARRKALYLRRTHAARVIQSTWRGYIQRKKYRSMQTWVIHIQSCARGLFGRREFYKRRCNAKAVVIQRYIRGWLARVRYRKIMNGFIRLQAHVRRRRAKKELKILKIEARSIEHVKGVAKGLENKIIELQQKLIERNKEVKVLREDTVALNNLKNEYNRMVSSQSESKVTEGRIAELEAQVAELMEKLIQEKALREEVEEERDRVKKDKDQMIDALSKDKVILKEELEKANERIKMLEQETDVVLRDRIREASEQKLREFEAERSHHQKLVKDHGRLQQRFENLQDEMHLMSPPGHRRSPSGVSNISLESEISVSTANDDVREDNQAQGEEDLGYGSGRRRDKEVIEISVPVDVLKQNSQPPKSGDKQVPVKNTDLSLVSRLQNRVKELQREKSQLQKEIDRFSPENDLGEGDPEREIYDTIKLQELEMENAKIRNELNTLRKAVADSSDLEGTGVKGTAAKKFMDQFDAMTDELNRRREECIQLRTLLATRSKGGLGVGVTEDSYGGHSDLVNEDGELEMAYKTQKDLNKLLENELQRTSKTHQVVETELRSQLTELKKDNDRQQKLIGQNLTLTPEAKIEATMQHEITRLTSENLDLREQMDKREEQIKKLKKALKIYAKRLKSTEGDWKMSRYMTKSMSIASDVQAELEREMAADEHMPTVKHHKEREYVGMYEYRKDDEPLLIRNLIIDLKPRLAAGHLPGLPSYVFFMCIRHTDYLNDDDKVRSLLTNVINGIKKMVKKRQDDVESITLWLSNTCRLIHNLKQYSGEKAFQVENTPKQNEHCLRNFDLSEYRQILNDLAVWIYQGLIKLMESQIHPMIVAAVLEHEAIAGLSAGKPTGLRGRLQSNSGKDGKSKDFSLDSLMKSLNNFLRVLNVHAVDPELVKQVFRQLFYFVSANALNNLLLRKDMCHWSKGMQIRYNISHLEQWMRDNKLQDCGASQALEPVVQASQLLQARKTDSDVDSICEMCSKLTTSQIIKVLNLYTPVNEFEERVPISFIRKIQERLSKRPSTGQTQTLLMDTKFMYAVTFPFTPSTLLLDTIVAPPEWGLGFLKRL